MITEEKSSLFEGVTVGLGIVIVFISTLSAPRLTSNMTRRELARERVREARDLTRLQATLTATQEYNATLRARLTEADSLLERAHIEMSALIEERDTLTAEVAAATSQLQDMEGKYQALQEETTESRKVLSAQQIVQERDAAVDRAKQAEERIRQLTLELNRAGIWP